MKESNWAYEDFWILLNSSFKFGPLKRWATFDPDPNLMHRILAEILSHRQLWKAQSTTEYDNVSLKCHLFQFTQKTNNPSACKVWNDVTRKKKYKKKNAKRELLMTTTINNIVSKQMYKNAMYCIIFHILIFYCMMAQKAKKKIITF